MIIRYHFVFQLPDGTTSLLPVMVFIHGGAFYAGEPSSLVYGPEYFLDKDVVLVLMAYRLSALGTFFTSLMTFIILGNDFFIIYKTFRIS